MSSRQLLVLVGVTLALLVVPGAGADVPIWVISPPGDQSVAANENTATGTFGWTDPTAADPGSNPVSVSCDHANPGAFPLGQTTTVTCTATDTITADTLSQDFRVTVTPDATPPSLVLPSSPVSVEVEGNVSNAVIYASPTANDPGGPISPPSCDYNSGDTFPYGTTTVHCTATDGGGNTTTGQFDVQVLDTTIPVITVPGNITVAVNGVASALVSYSPAPSASDPGGPIGAPTCSPASGSSFAVNTPTTVTCNVSDGVNVAAPKSFIVTVQDTTPPTITVPAPIAVNINNATSTNVSYTATATDGPTSITPSCAPASGSSFPLGATTVTCNATDAAGNAASPKSFTVTVADTTAPVVAIIGGPAATSSLRAASFDFTTSEGATTCRLDGGAFTACGSPAAYSGLGDGNHTFDIKAVDAGGNTATASRSWKIDATPPVLALPSTRIGEADGPGGAIASFTVSASDSGGALLQSAVTCTPGSGQLYPIGTTTVTCRVSDAAGNLATGSFDVVIQDTTAPAINAPNVSFTATSADGARKTDPDVAAYLAGVSASDLVSTPTLTNDMPNVLPIGSTTVVFTAKDEAGNSAKKSVTATVLPIGQKAPPPDLTPPADVLGAKAKAGDRTVTLSWKPLPKDVAYVVVTEFVVGEGGVGVGREIYNGAGNTVTAKGLVNGTGYRFLINAFDAAGNRSKGLILLATPKAEALTSPKQAQRVTKPPLLRWASSAGAAYFNVQLWRGSQKLLSAWPTATRYQLAAKWTFSGKARKLAPGLYTWYVWPGLGPRADAHYGALLGSRTFFYVSKPKK